MTRPARRIVPPPTRGAGLALALSALATLLFGVGAFQANAARSAPPADPEAFLAEPTALVEKTVGEVIVILQTPDLSSAERRRRIEALAFDVFDFTTMSKLVLARNWKKFDDAQRSEFIEQFKLYLSRNYGSRLDRYRQTDVVIVDARVEPRNDVTVQSKVVGGEFDDIKLDYRLRRRTAEWKVIDVVIEGVSLVANFRSQFREVLSQKGPEALLERMRAKNASPDPDEPEATATGSAS